MERLGMLIWILGLGIVFGSAQIYKKPTIYSMTIHTDIKYRFATTKVTSRVTNPGDTVRESLFDVTLPNEAFITNLTLKIDDKIVLGEIKEKEEAKQQYEAARSRGESAGHIETKHRETNRFTLSISVAPMSKVTFDLTYQELLKRTHGYYEEVIYIDPGQPVPELEVTVTILESRAITKLTVPIESNLADGELLGGSVAVIMQTSPTTAIVKYTPTLEQQKIDRESGLSGRFVVRYDVDRSMDAGEVMMVNGYFVHFFAPEGFKPMPNDVLFILDTSGSMYGQKIVQLKDAMLGILGDMHEGDRINILTFSSSFELWREEMVDIFDEDIRAETEKFIKSIQPSGSTDIELALRTGLQFMAGLAKDKYRSRVMLFLTDGEATFGITDHEQILNSVKKINSEARIPIFTLAFGQSADYDIVKRIAVQNNGFGRKIYEASDASMQIAGFYSEISVTLLNNITFNYLDVEEVTRTQFNNYFNGSEIIVCGTYRPPLNPSFSDESATENIEQKSLNLKVEGTSVEGPSVFIVVDEIDMDRDVSENLTSAADFEQITEKVWAYLTIKQLLEKKLASDNDTVKEQITAKVLDLSLKYGFVTPLTSMVVTLPNISQPKNTGDEQGEDAGFVDFLAKPARSMGSSSRINYLPSHIQSGPMGNLGPPSLAGSSYNFPPQSSAMKDYDYFPDYDYGIGIGPVQTPTMKSIQGKNRNRNKKEDKQKNKKKGNKNKKTKNRPDPLPLNIKTAADKKPFCFGLPVSQSSINSTVYRLFGKDGLGVNVYVSLSTTSSRTSNVTEVSRVVQGVVTESLRLQTGSDSKLEVQGNNCTIIVNKSIYTGLVIEANCGKHVKAHGGIIDTIAAKLAKMKGKKKSKTVDGENYLLQKYKARGLKCWRFFPKHLINLDDFIVNTI